MSLVPAFLIEGCLATLINTALAKNKYQVGEPFELEPLMRIGATYADMLLNETILQYPIDSQIIMERIKYFQSCGVLEVSEDEKTVRLTKDKNAKTLLDFFS